MKSTKSEIEKILTSDSIQDKLDYISKTDHENMATFYLSFSNEVSIRQALAEKGFYGERFAKDKSKRVRKTIARNLLKTSDPLNVLDILKDDPSKEVLNVIECLLYR